MTSIPLTSVKTSHYSTFPNDEPKTDKIKKLNELEKTASCRQTAAKIISVICCPFTTAFCVACSPCLACNSCFSDMENDEGTPYCYCTTCDSPCWNRALPAKDRCGLIPLAFDPFFYCCCCKNEGAKAFLTLSEREEMENLKVTLGDDSFPAEYRDRHKDAKPIKPVNYNFGIWGNLSNAGR